LADNPEKRAELIDHLAELRSRLVRCALYITCGAVAAWFLYEPFIYKWLTRPMLPVLQAQNTKFMFTSIIQPFMLRMQVSIVAGLILTLPLVTMEVWGFIAPGLRANEKRPLRWVAPLSIVLFAAGVALAYFILPWGFRWFAHYIPPNAEIRPCVPDTMRFVILMLLAFGVVFELPVFLMLLAQVGIIDSRMLKSNWRYCVVGITMTAAIICPSNDLPSMIAMAIPLLILYAGSIHLVKIVEKKPRKE
jgi:sec-independent protein translocase protein TatC